MIFGLGLSEPPIQNRRCPTREFGDNNLKSSKSQLSTVENRYDDTWDYTYDSTSGLLEQIDYPTNAYTTFAYDSMDRLRSMINRDKGAKILSQLKYHYDANSNVTKVELRDGDETTYSYDKANRLLCERRRNSSGNAKYYYRYAYDACSNRTQKVYFDGSKHITTYSYNKLNQLTARSGAEGDREYTYDANGNLTSIGEEYPPEWQYSYSVDNRLTSVKKLTGSKYATTFTYDPQGRLLKRIKKDGTELMYYYHGLTPYLVKKKSGENWVTHQTYTLAPGALGHIMHVRTLDGSTEDRYYHYDRLGNVMNITDENGLALVNYVQEGFGNVLLTQKDFARLEMHSPIAAYDLPEGSGSTTNDRTSNNYDGTISGASWTTGEFTYGLSFDGTNDKVSFSTHPSTSGSFSVAAWVKIDSTSWFHPVVTNFTPGMDIELKGWRFGVNNGKVCLQLWDCWEEPYEALGTTTLSTSKWYLIAATYDSSSDAMKVYVNGADDTSGSPTGDYTTGDNFGIGWDGVAHAMTQYYDGLIDSVAVWNTKISATEVEQLWDSGDKSGYHLTTKEYDPDAGLYYFWQRWYDPLVGRFTQIDPIIRLMSTSNRPTQLGYDIILKQYTFCNENPMYYTDPTGLASPLVSTLFVVCETVLCTYGLYLACRTNAWLCAITATVCFACYIADFSAHLGGLDAFFRNTCRTRERDERDRRMNECLWEAGV